jgi:hypothetical protein
VGAFGGDAFGLKFRQDLQDCQVFRAKNPVNLVNPVEKKNS